MRSIGLVGLLLVGSGCATPAPVPKMSAAEAFAPARDAEVDPAMARASLGSPREWAKSFRRDIDCEREARNLVKNTGRDVAWTYLKACVTRGYFTQLEALIQNWEDELKTKADAAPMIAAVIAARGGHLGVDLQLLQQRRIPVFDLASALKQSSAYKGRYLLFVGKISEAKEIKGRTELVLLEQALSSESATVMTGPMYGSTTTATGNVNATWRTTTSSGTASANAAHRGTVTSGSMENRVTDVFEETGQEVIAKLKQPDPFLTVDKNLVFLVRFDGKLSSDIARGEDPLGTALVTLISYHDL